jgi:hypothetical protein
MPRSNLPPRASLEPQPAAPSRAWASCWPRSAAASWDPVDAGINATRAKEAEDAVRPLKDQVVDVNVDRAISEAVQQSLRSVPGMQIAGMTLTKQMNDKAYEETFRAATANAVMFVNIDYHLSTDFSFFEVSARSRRRASRSDDRPPPSGGLRIGMRCGGVDDRLLDGTDCRGAEPIGRSIACRCRAAVRRPAGLHVCDRRHRRLA